MISPEAIKRIVLTLEVIDELSHWMSLEPEWSSFVRRCPQATCFQMPVWQYTWWSHFGSGRLRVFVFRQNGALAGIIPCFLHNWNGLRQITLIGSGISDYLEPVLAREGSDEMLEQLRMYLSKASDWDLCDWQDLAGDTVFRHLEDGGVLQTEIGGDTPCTRVALTGNFVDFWRDRPKDLRRNVRRYRQRAEIAGSLRFEVATGASPELVSALIDLHTARWTKRGMPGMVAANSSAGFLQDAACRFARQDMLRLFSLRYRDKIAALILGVRYAGTIYGYLTAFDPEYEALGFGRTLLFEALRYAFENGFVAWDFLRGDEPYKFWWGARAIPKCRLTVRRRE